MPGRDLTPTELRVAELVALGRRNEEAAAERGLEVKELGLRSRTGLAALAAGRDFP